MRKISNAAEQVLAAILSVGAVGIAIALIAASVYVLKAIADILR